MKRIGSVIAIISIIILTACGEEKLKKPDDFNFEVQSFNYTDQDGKTVSLEDLKGKMWIADFIFTSCKTVCPPMTNSMASLQKNIKEAGLEDVEIVSFSVDPEVDSPEKLKQFGKKHYADFSNWHFLTGYEQGDIEAFAEESFKAAVQKTAASDQVSHGTSFYLVDQSGTVVTRYSGTNRSDEDDQKVIQDIKALQQ
ncbi:SCO family protein [Pseudalkalibacillus salsuginis]|uniref:SCO family protein n=1 Tax=Pseudalkalibacillus salsuginis TaxID=2910972 RepID=UPI001F311ACB|nr:SCO family protein [Pseudalkalibacillus salsuginis]MCF6409430.1 SCO family protein [Pseudalkalibacillus salsuginis]